MDYERNKDILKELKSESTLDKIFKYKTSWTQYAERMQTDRLRKLLTNYKPHGLRNKTLPLRILLDD
jgi:hypothetical protein